ncbi:MAG TPA: TonB family protein [Blastocatellia bacterium]
MSKRACAIVFFLAASLVVPAAHTSSYAQSPVLTLTLGPNDIGGVHTASGITTRISFAETVKQIVCGDLFDPVTGRGAFLVQTNENEVYIKPVSDKGISNLFVKVGEKKGDQHIYNFDLFIVPVEQANRVVNVISAATLAAAANRKAESEDAKTSKKQTEPPVLERSRARAGVKETSATGDAAARGTSAQRVLAMYPPISFHPLSSSTGMTLASRAKSLETRDAAEGEPIKQVYPDYPEMARIMQITGSVNVAIAIDRNGNVAKARAVSGPQILRDAAVAAARAWKFSQTKVGGRPVAGNRVLTFNFKLGGNISAPDQNQTAQQPARDQELKTALEMVKKSLAVDPKNTLLLSSTGWIYFHMGQLDEAERYLSEAAQHEPKNSEVQERFGDICFSLSKKQDAEQAWRRALNQADDTEQKIRLNTKLGWVRE